MGRTPRFDPLDGWHHVMNRGVDSVEIFLDDADRIEFGRLLGEMSRRFGVEIHAYCLMGNHFHLLLRSRGGDLSEAMRWLQSIFATYVNRRHSRTGHLFGDRFTSRLLTTDRYVANVWGYVHRNPVDIVGSDAVIDYRWSSLRAYLELRPAPEWLQRDPVRQWFGSAGAMATFVSAPAQAGRSFPAAPASEIVTATDFVLDERSQVRLGCRRTERRAVLLDISQRVGGTIELDLHRLLGLDAPKALSTALWRARKHIAGNDRIDDHRRRIGRLLDSDATATLAA